VIFFNKLVGRASGGGKAQVTRRGLAGASDALLMSDVRHIALPIFKNSLERIKGLKFFLIQGLFAV